MFTGKGPSVTMAWYGAPMFGDEPFDVVERDLFGAAEQYTYAVAETVVVFLEETE